MILVDASFLAKVLLEEEGSDKAGRCSTRGPECWKTWTKESVGVRQYHAFEVAVQDRSSVYDALYLAASIVKGSSLATFDSVIREKALKRESLPQTQKAIDLNRVKRWGQRFTSYPELSAEFVARAGSSL